MKKGVRLSLWILWIGLTVVGCAGVIERIVHGHQSAAYGSYIVWGLWVSSYIYFIGLSVGAFLLSSLITVFGMKRLERVGRLALFMAIITLFMALISIWFDLGHMERAYRVITSPNFRSMMAWMIWLYTIYTLLMISELWLYLRNDLSQWTTKAGFQGWLGRTLSFTRQPLSESQKSAANHWLKVLALVGIPLAITFSGGVGALFSTLSARSFWHTSLMPLLFLTGALVSGGALMAFTVSFLFSSSGEEYKGIVILLGKIILGLLIFDIILEWAEFSVPMWYGVGHEYELLKNVLFGDFWWVFWILHLGFGTVLPVVLLITKGQKHSWAVGLAGFLIASTFMTVRLNIVIPGLIDPPLKILQKAFTDHRLIFTYIPSWFEWQIVFFVVAFGMALFYLGFRFLPLVNNNQTQSKFFP